MTDVKLKLLADELRDLQEQQEQTRRAFQEQSVLIEHLREATRKKDARIAKLEADISRMFDQHQIELQLLQEENQTTGSHAHHAMRKLQLDLERTQDENAILRGYEDENKQLRELLDETQKRMEALEQDVKVSKSGAQDDMIRYRQILESEFKQRLKECEEQARIRAAKELADDAAGAFTKSQKLSSALAKQNENMEDLLKRFGKMETAYERLKAEHDVDKGQTDQQMQMYVALKSKLSASEARVADLEQSLRVARVERSSIELLYTEREAALSERSALQARLVRAKEQIVKWRTKYQDLLSQLPHADQLRANSTSPSGGNYSAQGDDFDADLERSGRSRSPVHACSSSSHAQHAALARIRNGHAPNSPVSHASALSPQHRSPAAHSVSPHHGLHAQQGPQGHSHSHHSSNQSQSESNVPLDDDLDLDIESALLQGMSQEQAERRARMRQKQEEAAAHAVEYKSLWNSSMIHVPSIPAPDTPGSEDGGSSRGLSQQSYARRNQVPVQDEIRKKNAELSVLSKSSARRDRVVQNRKSTTGAGIANGGAESASMGLTLQGANVQAKKGASSTKP